MQKFYEVAGEVMGFFDAFKGSRPAIDNDKILIVRGRSRKTLDINDFNSKLNEIGSIINGKEIESDSKKITKLLESGDKSIQESEGQTTNIDKHGLERMQEELEAMGLIVEYKAFELPCCYVVIAIWQDKHGYPPLYVEVTVSEKEE